jgi:hypothetical protein
MTRLSHESRPPQPQSTLTGEQLRQRRARLLEDLKSEIRFEAIDALIEAKRDPDDRAFYEDENGRLQVPRVPRLRRRRPC